MVAFLKIALLAFSAATVVAFVRDLRARRGQHSPMSEGGFFVHH